MQRVVININARKCLVVGGLLYILVSMIYGSVFGAFFHDSLDAQQQRGLENALVAGDNIQAAMKEYEDANHILGRFKGSHSHLALFGLIALVLAPVLRYLTLSHTWLNTATVVYLLGGAMLPFGAFLRMFHLNKLGFVSAAVGGTLLMIAIGIYTVGAWLNREPS